MRLNIGWLFPEFMSTYGDRGNVICLSKRAQWRGISTDITPISTNTPIESIESLDLIIGGGAQNKEQEHTLGCLKGRLGEKLVEKLSQGTPGLLICASFQLFGRTIETDYSLLEGLAFFNCHTRISKESKKRLRGDLIFQITAKKLLEESDLKTDDPLIIGFENHSGRTFVEEGEPLGKVLIGYGNNGDDGCEGLIQHNTLGSYAHGPLLPKNPFLADWLLGTALRQKYRKEVLLKPLPDLHAASARMDLLKRFGLK